MITAYFGPQSPRENKAVGDFVSRIIWGEPGRLTDYCTMGVFRDQKLVAGVAYTDWHPDKGTIDISGGSTMRHWMTKSVITDMFSMPFDVLGVRLVVMRVSEHNARMRGICQRTGFQETIVPRMRGENEAECIYTLSAADWLNHRMNENGRKRT